MKKLLLLTRALFSLVIGISYPAPINAVISISKEFLKKPFVMSLTEEEQREILTAAQRDYAVHRSYNFYRALQTTIPQASIPAEALPGRYDKQVQSHLDKILRRYTEDIKFFRHKHQQNTFEINSFSSFLSVYAALMAKLISITNETQTSPLPQKKWHMRFCRAITGAAKITPWLIGHTLWPSGKPENSPQLFFNGIKLLSLYILFDLTHHYGTDILAKSFPVINKCDNALRSRIKKYDTLKKKLGWLAKASLAAYQSHVYL